VEFSLVSISLKKKVYISSAGIIEYNIGIIRSFLERSGRKFGEIPARDFSDNSC
jgi:hypothetical protein